MKPVRPTFEGGRADPVLRLRDVADCDVVAVVTVVAVLAASVLGNVVVV